MRVHSGCVKRRVPLFNRLAQGIASVSYSTDFPKSHMFARGLGEIRKVGGDRCGSIVGTTGTTVAARVNMFHRFRVR